jgi:tol-pal system protein YbgF
LANSKPTSYDLLVRTFSPRLPVALLGIFPLVAGCSHQDPADRSVENLKAEITKMQADRDRFDERLGALEAAEQRRDDAERRPRVAKNEMVPRLPVVRVGDGDGGSALSPSEGEVPDVGSDTDAPRPVVEASGPAGSSRRGRAGSADNPGSSLEAKRDYEAALAQVRAKQYDKALEAFTAFLVRYPDHLYADNAMYWRGECFYAKGDFAKAAEQFEGLLARFPNGNKAPDALLKIGLCQQRMGSREQAQHTFAELKERYPKSEAVRQIPRP